MAKVVPFLRNHAVNCKVFFATYSISTLYVVELAYTTV
jgi:hypothetical protein